MTDTLRALAREIGNVISVAERRTFGPDRKVHEKRDHEDMLRTLREWRTKLLTLTEQREAHASLVQEMETLIAKWQETSAGHKRLSRVANHQGNKERDAYNDGKHMGIEECIYDAERVLALLRRSPAPVTPGQGYGER